MTDQGLYSEEIHRGRMRPYTAAEEAGEIATGCGSGLSADPGGGSVSRLKHQKYRGSADSMLVSLEAYKCPFCDFRHTHRSRLEAHLRVHSAAKPFRCAGCGFQTGDKAVVVKHMRETHGASAPARNKYSSDV